jgi:hypothetical protein
LAIADLLKLDVDAAAYLPPDTKSDNFDNIADVQALSPTLLSAYLRAASDLSRLAIGNAAASAASNTYTMPKLASQVDHVEGTPFGSRGGMAVVHMFPADGEYRFDVNFFHETTGAFAGGLARGEQRALRGRHRQLLRAGEPRHGGRLVLLGERQPARGHCAGQHLLPLAGRAGLRHGAARLAGALGVALEYPDHLADALDYYEERCEEKQCIPLHAHQRLLPGALSFSLIP